MKERMMKEKKNRERAKISISLPKNHASFSLPLQMLDYIRPLNVCGREIPCCRDKNLRNKRYNFFLNLTIASLFTVPADDGCKKCVRIRFSEYFHRRVKRNAGLGGMNA